MITQQALQEAIAECLGQKNPNRDTCQMLAAFYTIQDHLYPQERPVPQVTPMQLTPQMIQAFAHAAMEAPKEPGCLGEYGETDFLKSVAGKNARHIMVILDKLMDDIKITNHRVYDGVMYKINAVKRGEYIPPELREQTIY